jgi:hypothetical protein
MSLKENKWKLYLLGCFFFVKMDRRTFIVVKVSCSRIRFDDHCLKSISVKKKSRLIKKCSRI